GVRLLFLKVAAIPRFARGRLALVAVLALGVMTPAGAAAAADEDAPAADAKPASGDEAPTPATPTPSLRVTKLQFRGNRKVEDDAIKVNLKTAVGVTLTQEMIRDDVRAIWKMGYFDDVQVEVAEGKAGSTVTFVLREKPAIKKIYVAGNEEVALSKI